MNENLQMVEKLAAETGVSYTEAKATLEKTNWDLLDAIIELESQGYSVHTAHYSTRDGGDSESGGDSDNSDEAKRKHEEAKRKHEEAKRKHEEYKKNTVSVFKWLGGLFDKGNKNDIELYRGGEKKIGMPITLFILLCFVTSGVLLIFMIISLFFGCSYRFSGPDLGKEEVNKVMNKASDYAENIKKDIKDTTET